MSPLPHSHTSIFQKNRKFADSKYWSTKCVLLLCVCILAPKPLLYVIDKEIESRTK